MKQIIEAMVNLLNAYLALVNIPLIGVLMVSLLFVPFVSIKKDKNVFSLLITAHYFIFGACLFYFHFFIFTLLLAAVTFLPDITNMRETHALIHAILNRYSESQTVVLDVVGAAMAYYFLRGFRWFSRYVKRIYLRTTSLEQFKKTNPDTRQTKEWLAEFATRAGKVDVEKYFDKAKAKNALYVGLDQSGDPVYIPRASFVQSNGEVAGPTRSGKGVLSANVLAQGIKNFGDLVIVIAPKKDKYQPRSFQTQCKKAGKTFVYIDLTKDACINPFSNLNALRLYELLVQTLAVYDRGAAADYYAQRKRTELLRGCEAAAQIENCCVYDLIDIFEGINAADEENTEAYQIAGLLRELALTGALNTQAAPMEGMFHEDIGCVYIEGDDSYSTYNKLLKVVMERVIMMTYNNNSGRHISIFIDEFPLVMTRSIVSRFGTVAGQKSSANIIINHQSLGDFDEIQDFSSEAAKNKVFSNCAYKWLYRQTDGNTATWISEFTGEVDCIKRAYSTSQARDADGNMRTTQSKTISYEKKRIVDVDAVQNLPNKMALFVGDNDQRLVMIDFLPIDESLALPAPVQFTPYKTTAEEEAAVPATINESEDFL